VTERDRESEKERESTLTSFNLASNPAAVMPAAIYAYTQKYEE
jgi:hypothetical protein